MKSYVGEQLTIEGRGDVLYVELKEGERSPSVGDVILANGRERTVRDIEHAGASPRIGIVLHGLV